VLINFTSCVLCVERNLMRIKMFYMGEKPPRAQLALAIVFLFFYTLSLLFFPTTRGSSSDILTCTTMWWYFSSLSFVRVISLSLS
jgi:hypothetical protein